MNNVCVNSRIDVYFFLERLSFLFCFFIFSFACGIIARSAGLFQNKKTVCTCSGKTIWEERMEAREEIG